MKKIALPLVSFSLFMAACSNQSQKLIVFVKGTASWNDASKTIKLTNGGGHDELTVNLGGGENTITLDGSDQKNTITTNSAGLWIVNAKADTIVGGLVNYVDPSNRKNVTTQEELKQNIDSLIKMVNNQNISAQNKTFYLLPNTTVKVSENVLAEVVGPFHRMTTANAVDGKAPEVYRFYSLSEIRETIEKLTKLTVADKPTDEK